MALMTRFRDMRVDSGWSQWVKVAVAVWLFISPWVLLGGTGQAGAAGGGDIMHALSWNAWISAVLLAGLAIAATSERSVFLGWLTLTLGAWIFISPWVQGYAGQQFNAVDWNNLAIGALTFFLSAGELGLIGRRVAATGAQPTGADLSYAGDRPQQVEPQRERRF